MAKKSRKYKAAKRRNRKRAKILMARICDSNTSKFTQRTAFYIFLHSRGIENPEILKRYG